MLFSLLIGLEGEELSILSTLVGTFVADLNKLLLVLGNGSFSRSSVVIAMAGDVSEWGVIFVFGVCGCGWGGRSIRMEYVS